MNHSKFVLKTTPRRQLAIDCLKHKLYVKGWMLRNVLLVLAVCPSKGRIVVAYSESMPIGVMVIYPWLSLFWPMCFVNPKYRRQGIGTLLFRHLEKTYGIDKSRLEHSKGKPGSVKFFSSLGVVRNDYE